VQYLSLSLSIPLCTILFSLFLHVNAQKRKKLQNWIKRRRRVGWDYLCKET
jgi:hypothetical protein